MTGNAAFIGVFLFFALTSSSSAEAKCVQLDTETMKTDSGSFLRLHVNPTDIISGLTRSMTLNCSFSFHETLNMSGMTSLILSKYVSKENQEGHFVDLASLISLAPDQVNVLPELDAAFHGHLDVDGESFLSIEWSYPTEDEAGQYRCEVHGLENMGHATEMFQTKQVTSTQSNVPQLADKVIQLHRQLDYQENLTGKLSHENSKCQSKLELQTNVTKKQSDEISWCQLQVEHQETLAQNQSEEISECQSQLQLQNNVTKKQSREITDMEKKINLLKFMITDFYISEEYNGHYYLLSRKDWYYATEAAQTCQDVGGYLAQITDDSENQFLKEFVDLTQYHGIYAVLVSGTDIGHEGRWTFTGTETDIVFFDWGPGEPGGGMTHCLALYGRFNLQWRWADIICSLGGNSKHKFLCELETL